MSTRPDDRDWVERIQNKGPYIFAVVSALVVVAFIAVVVNEMLIRWGE